VAAQVAQAVLEPDSEIHHKPPPDSTVFQTPNALAAAVKQSHSQTDVRCSVRLIIYHFLHACSSVLFVPLDFFVNLLFDSPVLLLEGDLGWLVSSEPFVRLAHTALKVIFFFSQRVQ